MFARSTRSQRLVRQLLATLVAIPFAFPLYSLVAISFEGQGPAVNYAAVVTQTPFLRFMLNSVIISLGTIAVVLVCTMTAGYAFTKLRFRGRTVLLNGILVGLVLPAIALIVPMFIIVMRLGLFDNYLAVILPLSAVIIPFTLLLTYNYLQGSPNEVIEAAKIDGASNVRILLQVVLPLAKPLTAIIVVWTFLQSWNEFFLPLLFLQDPDRQAITQVPTYFTSTYGSDVPKIFAALVLLSLPVVIAYLSLQKFFERGLTAGSVK